MSTLEHKRLARMFGPIKKGPSTRACKARSRCLIFFIIFLCLKENDFYFFKNKVDNALSIGSDSNN